MFLLCVDLDLLHVGREAPYKTIVNVQMWIENRNYSGPGIPIPEMPDRGSFARTVKDGSIHINES